MSVSTQSPKQRVIGVIGGSGLYEMEGLTEVERVRVDTPFGAPSDEYVVGRLGDAKLVFLPRHGRGHRLLPHEINFRANLHGLKQLGVEWVLSVSAVGSLRAEIAPGHIVLPDQFIDRTKNRPSTFFGDGVVAHVAFGDPICGGLHAHVARGAQIAVDELGTKLHVGGTHVVMEGPAFSTRAESNLYRSWGAHIIGMTNLPEAKLAREAELCYAVIALATDYDCWHETEEDVSVETVVATLTRNVELAKRIITHCARLVPAERSCACAHALDHAVMTAPHAIPAATRARLALLLGNRFSGGAS
jgi:5'-methylthioadenosine phosphorylase